jgi:hypothetical protein
VHVWQLDELNQAFVDRGYSQASAATSIFGLWAGAGGERWRMAVLFGGAGENFRHLRDEIDARVYYLMGELQAGYNVYRNRGFSVYPLLGVGGGGARVWAKTSDAAQAPLLADEVGNVDDGFEVSKPIAVVDLGLGIQTVIGFGRSGESGIGLGLQIGYLIQWLDADWSNANLEDGPSIEGPAADVGGAYIRLSIGWGLDGVEIESVRRPVPACTGTHCDLVCEPGFANCDGDPRNGCETPAPAGDSEAAATCRDEPRSVLELEVR